MSRIKGLTVLCCVVLCSQITCAGQTVMGIDELFRLADENSTSIRSYETGAESADEALKAAKAQRLPEIGISGPGACEDCGRSRICRFHDILLGPKDSGEISGACRPELRCGQEPL